MAVALKDLDRDYLLCRDLRHQWDNVATIITTNAKRGRHLERATTCLRCETVRIEAISLTTFRVLGRKYEYPDGFILQEKTPFDRIREASIRMQIRDMKAKAGKGKR